MYKPKTNVPNTADSRNIKLAKLWIVILYAVVYIGEPSNVPKPSITLMNAYILPVNYYYYNNKKINLKMANYLNFL